MNGLKIQIPCQKPPIKRLIFPTQTITEMHELPFVFGHYFMINFKFYRKVRKCSLQQKCSLIKRLQYHMTSTNQWFSQEHTVQYTYHFH